MLHSAVRLILAALALGLVCLLMSCAADYSKPYGEPGTYEELRTPEELKQFLLSHEEERVIRFRYTGDADFISGKNLAQILCSYTLSLNTLDSTDGIWQVEHDPYPGERIYRAYLDGTMDTLPSDMSATLDMAMQIAQTATAVALTEVEAELAIFNMLCDAISYTDVPDMNAAALTDRSPLTCVGALLDGQANCQGYTDAFYLTASLAGLEVDSQATDEHMFNTVCLGDRWYIADLTYADGGLSREGGVNCYHLFNAAADMCADYSWPTEAERHPIAETSDENYYFYYPHTEKYVRCHDYPSGACADILKEYRDNGRSNMDVMLRGSCLSADELTAALNGTAESMGMNLAFTLWSATHGNNTYFHIEIE